MKSREKDIPLSVYRIKKTVSRPSFVKFKKSSRRVMSPRYPADALSLLNRLIEKLGQ
jgi:hypothetical protein